MGGAGEELRFCDAMKKYAESFYKSRTWRTCRDGYAKSVGNLCEDCLEKGIYRPGEIVHHITEITPDNIDDPSITLSWDNLRLVCCDCHAEKHAVRVKRYKIDEAGRVQIRG